MQIIFNSFRQENDSGLIHIYTYILYLIAWIRKYERGVPGREILINVHGCEKNIYPNAEVPSAQASLAELTFKSKSDKRGTGGLGVGGEGGGDRLYVSFTHTHAHTLIKTQASPYVHK